jgi:hypothetical protein
VWRQGPSGTGSTVNLQNSNGGAPLLKRTLIRSGSAQTGPQASNSEVPRHLSAKEYEALRTFTQILVEKEGAAGRNKGEHMLNGTTTNSSTQKFEQVITTYLFIFRSQSVKREGKGTWAASGPFPEKSLTRVKI